MRTCGQCVACCTYLRVAEIQKEGLTRCPHLLPGGDLFTGPGEHNCTIPLDRPETCKGYRCTWLDGHGHENDRPDRSGVLIDRTKRIGGAVECKPLRQEATDTDQGKLAISRVCNDAGMVGLVLSWCEQRLVRVEGAAP